jgi:hypothetical protein
MGVKAVVEMAKVVENGASRWADVWGGGEVDDYDDGLVMGTD